MEVILGEEIDVPCPICDTNPVSTMESHKYACPQCMVEFTESQLREKWDFL